MASQLASAQMKRRLSVTKLSSENNLPTLTFRLNAPVVIRAKADKYSVQNFNVVFTKLTKSELGGLYKNIECS